MPQEKRQKDVTCIEEVSDSEGLPNSSKAAEIQRAKTQVLQKVTELRDSGLESDELKRRWRLLLREWHPDKHLDKEVSTAVFQFLQKARPMLGTQ